MLYSTTSVETITLLEFNQPLTFSSLEFYRDAHVVIVQLDVINNGLKDEAISNQHFTLSHNRYEVVPSVSYVSELNKQGKLWSWLRLRPREACTIIFRFQLEPRAGAYDFKYNHRQKTKLIQTFKLE